MASAAKGGAVFELLKRARVERQHRGFRPFLFHDLNPIGFAESSVLILAVCGQGSARGSAGAFIRATEPSACLAAASTSSGNPTNALSSPARRASSSIVLSMIGALRRSMLP